MFTIKFHENSVRFIFHDILQYFMKCSNANALALPFCFARHGLLLKSVSQDDITALYIAAVKRCLGPLQAATLEAAIASNRAGFAALSWATQMANFARSYKSQ